MRAVQLRHPRGLPGEQERPGVLPQGMLQQGQREDQELSDVSLHCMRFNRILDNRKKVWHYIS